MGVYDVFACIWKKGYISSVTKVSYGGEKGLMDPKIKDIGEKRASGFNQTSPIKRYISFAYPIL